MEMMKRSEIESIITREIQPLRKRGWTFGVSFIKKDGTKRTMSCRFGVKKHLKGGTRSWSRVNHPHLMTVFDMGKGKENAKLIEKGIIPEDAGYRTINLNTIYRVSIDDVEYRVVD